MLSASKVVAGISPCRRGMAPRPTANRYAERWCSTIIRYGWAAVLVPWAIPTVVAALLWRFIFESQGGIANALLVDAGFLKQPMVWFIQTSTAWVPVILADVWKTTPFVALLLLAGLQNIDLSLYEAAAVDGANAWWQLRHITLPLLKPAMLRTDQTRKGATRLPTV